MKWSKLKEMVELKLHEEHLDDVEICWIDIEANEHVKPEGIGISQVGDRFFSMIIDSETPQQIK